MVSGKENWNLFSSFNAIVNLSYEYFIGTAPEFDRQISHERKLFLRNFVEAQMVTYEAVDQGVSSGWFYWTFKME